MQVRWQGWDVEGRPLLVVKIARACEECSGPQAEAVAAAILSQVCGPACAVRVLHRLVCKRWCTSAICMTHNSVTDRLE